MTRVLISDFGIIQKTFANASVTFYVTDANGVNTGVKATIYQASTGTASQSNPQTLDANGMLAQACYVDSQIMGAITGISALTERGVKKIRQNPLEFSMPVTSSNWAKQAGEDLYTDLASVQAAVAEVEAILADAGFIAVSTDLLGADTIGTVAGIAGAVVTVAGNTANINTVSSNLTGSNTIGTVAAAIANVNAVGTNIAHVVAVDGNATNINAAVANATNINTVAGDHTVITTVAGDHAVINIVAGDHAAIVAVNADLTNINNVAADLTNINLVAGDLTNINLVAADLTNIDSVHGSLTSINNVAADLTQINAVAADLTQIVGVYSDLTNINNVAADLTNINVVAGDLTNINAVKADLANIDIVAGIAANVTTVAGMQSNIATVVANMTTITNAANNIPKANLAASVAPTVSDDNTQGYSAGSMWVDTTHAQVYFALSVATGAASWEQAFSASTLSGLSDVSIAGLASHDTLQYNSGTSKWNNVAAATALLNIGGAPLASPTFTGTVGGISVAMITGAAPLDSPSLTGTPLAPTATALTSTTQIATTAYVDNAVAVGITGLQSKGAVDAISTTNIAGTYLAGVFTVTATDALTVDGVTCSLNKLVALVGQTATGGTGTVNGIYKVTTAGSGGISPVLTRATNFDSSAEAAAGAYFIVDGGTVNTGTFWVNTTSGAVVLDTTVLVFTEVTVGALSANSLTGTTLASNVVTSSLTAVGTIATGVWNGTIITSGFGGTGNGFTKFSGPTTAERTKTLRDASDTILELGGSYTPTGTWTSLTMVTPVLGTPTSGTLTNCSGTAASLTAGNATKLATARAINGVNFDGSAAITVSGGYRALSSTDTVVATDNGKTLTISGTCALALTAAATIGNFSCFVQNTATTGILIITITPNGSDNLDAANSTLVILPGETRELNCNATAWTTVVVTPFKLNMTVTASPTLPRTGYQGIYGQLWGGGASGGAGATNGGGGGGGGSYQDFLLMNGTITIASLALTCTIGAGGLSQTSANTAGNAGGLTSVVTGGSITLAGAYGGGAGGGGSLGAGGGGGSIGGPSVTTGNMFTALGVPAASGVGGNAVTTTNGAGGIDLGTSAAGAGTAALSIYAGGGGGTSTTNPGGGAYKGGGGGGVSKATTGAAGGTSLYGGGGGGGASNATGGAGGGSAYGGAGGAGGNGGAGTGGAVGGGGGGGAVGTAGSGAGGGGRIILVGIF